MQSRCRAGGAEVVQRTDVVHSRGSGGVEVVQWGARIGCAEEVVQKCCKGDDKVL